MKTFIFSALALGFLAGCSGSEIEGVVDNGEPVAIQLSAGVQTTTVISRAPIAGSAMFKPTILGWEGATEDYAANPTWTSTTGDVRGDASSAPITLTPVQYYNADGATTTFMKAFYAEGATLKAESKAIYEFENATGQKDLLVAAAISGTKATTTAAAFTFTHPLMQLQFMVQAGKGFPDGRKLTSIKVKNVSVPTSIDLSTNTIGYTTPSDLSVVDGGADTITTTATAVGSMMIKPIAAGTDVLTLDVVAGEKTYKGIKVTLVAAEDHADGAGVAYVVTLTFQEKMSATASVTGWIASTGSGTVE